MGGAGGVQETDIDSIGEYVEPHALCVLFHAHTQPVPVKLCEAYAWQYRSGNLNKRCKVCYNCAS